MTKRESTLYAELKRIVHYAACLENECERLGGSIKSPRNKTIESAQGVLRSVDGGSP